MKSLRGVVATLELTLIFPAVLFMTALFVRNLQPQEFEPARTAERIVAWYAARPHLGLWFLLTGFPLGVLLIGCVSLARSWRSDPELRVAALAWAGILQRYFALFLIALAAAASAGILGIVALHLITG